jgi:cysteine-rich repeat protein
VGGIYEVAVFQAERHTASSSYHLTLNKFETRRTVCTATCGNNQRDPGEECDELPNAGGYGKCGRGCVWGPRCGDGIKQSDYGEECDDGNTAPGDGCDTMCKVTSG